MSIGPDKIGKRVDIATNPDQLKIKIENLNKISTGIEVSLINVIPYVVPDRESGTNNHFAIIYEVYSVTEGV